MLTLIEKNKHAGYRQNNWTYPLYHCLLCKLLTCCIMILVYSVICRLLLMSEHVEFHFCLGWKNLIFKINLKKIYNPIILSVIKLYIWRKLSFLWFFQWKHYFMTFCCKMGLTVHCQNIFLNSICKLQTFQDTIFLSIEN